MSRRTDWSDRQTCRQTENIIVSSYYCLHSKIILVRLIWSVYSHTVQNVNMFLITSYRVNVIISKAALCFRFMMPRANFVVVKMCSDSCDSSRETFFSDNSRTTLKHSRMLPPCGLYWYSSHSVNSPSQTLQTRNTLMKGLLSEVDNKILFNGHNAPYLKTNYNFRFWKDKKEKGSLSVLLI